MKRRPRKAEKRMLSISIAMSVIGAVFIAVSSQAATTDASQKQYKHLVRVTESINLGNAPSTAKASKATSKKSASKKKAGQAVAASKKSKPVKPVEGTIPRTEEQKTMQSARVAFEKKDFATAMKLYETIPATSDYWTEALEERAWSHVHLMEHDKALGLVKTLTAPPVKYEIGSEPYLLSSLVQLRLCNYNEIFKVMKRFKEDVKPRFEAMQALSKSGTSDAANRAIGRMQTLPAGERFTRAAAGGDVASLPRLFYRDAAIQSRLSQPATEDQVADVSARMKALAKRDVSDIEGVLRKMHLIEVEATQRMYSHLNLADKKKSAAPISRDANTLVFPDDEDDVWLDEVDAYHVDAKGCPGLPQGPKS